MTISSWLSLLYYSEHLHILTFSKQSIIHKNKDRNIKSSLSMRFVNLFTFNYFSTIFKAESANINILQIQHQTKSTLFQLSWIFSFPLLNTIIKDSWKEHCSPVLFLFSCATNMRTIQFVFLFLLALLASARSKIEVQLDAPYVTSKFSPLMEASYVLPSNISALLPCYHHFSIK